MEENGYQILYIGNSAELLSPLQHDPEFQITSKENALLALDYLRDKENKPDAILCSMMLRGTNGIHFLEEFKRQHFEFSKQTPFIIISKNFRQSIRQQVYRAGADDYYAGPLSSDKLKNRIGFLTRYKAHAKEIVTHDSETQQPQTYKTPFVKRLFDITMSGGALIALSPLMLLTSVAIYLESRGKVFYASRRVGANFRTFNFYKFRSMYPDADKRLKEVAHLNQYKSIEVEETCSECAKLPEGQYCSPVYDDDNGEKICERMIKLKRKAEVAFLKIENDPRITKVGKFIRNTSIDELPQLINILKGDMSIVGNRPLPVSEANALTKSERGKRLELGMRFNCAAGLTGLWQVELRGKAGGMSEEERFELDKQYALDNSFTGDIRLILRTFKVFLNNENV